MKTFFKKFALILTAIFFAACDGDTGGGTDENNYLESVSITPETLTIDAEGKGELIAKVTLVGSPKVTYKWEVTDGGNYVSVGGTDKTATVNGTNTTNEERTAKVTVTASDGSNTKTATATITVKAKGSSSTDTDTSKGVISVTLNKTSLNLLTDGTATLTATVNTTSDSIAKTVTWKSSNEKVATVTDGTVTAVGAGNTTITATSTVDTSKYATCTVTVTQANSNEVLWRADDYDVQTISSETTLGIMTVLASSEKTVDIDSNSKSIDGYAFTKRLKFGGTGTSSARALKFTTESSSKITVYFMSSSSDTSRTLNLYKGTEIVAGGSNDGNAIGSFSTTTALEAGTYLIYGTDASNVYAVKIAYEAAQSVVYPSGITLSPTTLSLDVSDDSTTKTGTLTATITNASEVTEGYDSIEWSSNNESVATVSNGKVTAKKAGAATITASCTHGGADATCTVTVTGAPTVTYDIDVVPGAKVTTYGWADMANNGAGMSYPNTDNIIVINDAKYPTATEKRTAFTNAIASGSVSSGSVNDTKAIIVLSGTVDLSDGKISDTDHTYFDDFNSSTYKRTHEDIVYEIGSNKAIIGVNGAKVAFGGLQIYANNCARENIIIQNIDFWDAHGSTEEDTTYKSSSKASADNLVLEVNSKDITTASDETITYNHVPTNIWIDHCKFSDGTCSDLTRNYNHDGSLDMKAGKNVTVSYCEFTNHDKVTLLAPNDKYVDEEQRQITFHHNYYHDAVQRMPRSRGCQLHIYNNYYNTIGTSGNGGYTLGPGIHSQYIVENNYFSNWYTSSCLVKYFDSSTDHNSSKLYQSGNNVTFSANNVAGDSDTEGSKTVTWGNHSTSTAPWTINYTYKTKLAEASALPTLIPAAAGTDKEGYSATVRVNGVPY